MLYGLAAVHDEAPGMRGVVLDASSGDVPADPFLETSAADGSNPGRIVASIGVPRGFIEISEMNSHHKSNLSDIQWCEIPGPLDLLCVCCETCRNPGVVAGSNPPAGSAGRAGSG